MSKSILVIDDDKAYRDMLCLMLKRAGYIVEGACDGGVAISLSLQKQFDLVVTDLLMPGVEGMETIRNFKKKYPNLPVIAISGGGRGSAHDYLETARILGADACLEKPFEKDYFIEKIRELLKEVSPV